MFPLSGIFLDALAWDQSFYCTGTGMYMLLFKPHHGAELLDANMSMKRCCIIQGHIAFVAECRSREMIGFAVTVAV
jgi:hypothetical protein